MKLLFINRKYPPMVGGMENMCLALSKEFSKQVDTTLISWGKSQKFLPYFLLMAFLKACFYIPSKKIDHIHLGDGLLAPLGIVLKHLFRIKTTVTIAGLDITFTLPIYQMIIPHCVARLDKVICISEATKKECLKRGIPADKCIVIPCGVYPEDFITNGTKSDLEKIINIPLNDKKVIITVGRLVKRKGVHWFIENVIPNLSKNTVYLVIGDGQEREVIEQTVKTLGLDNQVFLLGKVQDSDLKVIYNTADLFVMPNIKVKGDMEGFGIVAIEAGSTGLPVVAADMEGIKDAVINGVTGKLIPSMSVSHFIDSISHFRPERMSVSHAVASKYSWSSIGNNYINHFNER